MWRNWQTRKIQVLVGVKSLGGSTPLIRIDKHTASASRPGRFASRWEVAVKGLFTRTASIASFIVALPKAMRWVRSTVAAHAPDAERLDALPVAGALPQVSASLLARTKRVVVDDMPQPPLEAWKISGVGDIGWGLASGLALMQMIFIRRGREDDPSLLFHELVHVIQWETLGPRRFLILYGVMLLELGYADHPLEIMAYELQERFDRGQAAFDIEPIVRRRTIAAWADFTRRSLVHRAVGAALRVWPEGKGIGRG